MRACRQLLQSMSTRLWRLQGHFGIPWLKPHSSCWIGIWAKLELHLRQCSKFRKIGNTFQELSLSWSMNPKSLASVSWSSQPSLCVLLGSSPRLFSWFLDRIRHRGIRASHLFVLDSSNQLGLPSIGCGLWGFCQWCGSAH